ncbi:hypothetical protein DJ030_18325 [bacterium endosymbiont of Escarpia laminata]|nr:MAG: hypothetical protein DJ030_18325 [bacterium endosymbiont of Escarpia laminata]
MFNHRLKMFRFNKQLLLLILCSPLVMAGGSSTSNTMARAMLSMMDAMGKIANQSQDSNPNDGFNWSSGNNFQPFNSWQNMAPAPWSLYTMPGSAIPGQQMMPGMTTPAMPSVTQQPMQGMMSQAPALAKSGQEQMQNLGNQVTGGATPATSNIQPYQQTAPASATQRLNMSQSPLDGVWKGQSGMVLILAYGHFRIYADRDRYFDGQYRLGQNRLLIHDPKSNKTQAYEFAHNQGRMVLKGTQNQLLLFRKMPIQLPSPSAIQLLPQQ